MTKQPELERRSRAVWLAALGLAGAVALAGCDADYQHVSDTALVREAHPGRVADPEPQRVPHGTAAGDTAARRDPTHGAPAGTLAEPGVAPPQQQPQQQPGGEFRPTEQQRVEQERVP